MSILIEKWPMKAQQFLKYMQSIRFAASKFVNSGWVQYDEQYRLKKARYPESSWGIIDQELWVLLVATESVRSFNPNFESKFDARSYSGSGQRSNSFQERGRRQ